MTRLQFVVIGVIAGTVLWTGLAAQQEVQPRPGPGSGVTNVSVVNRPAVLADQLGDWQVAISRMPTVGVRVPPFAFKGTRYLVTWPNGDIDKIAIVDTSEDGWVQVENTGGRMRWLNLSTARSLEEVK
jgi:hypothetical protein